jgi:hypothetical protein
MTGTRACWVNRENGEVRFEPLHNGGTSGPERGFSPVPGTAQRMPEATASVDAVGRAALGALALPNVDG